MLCFCNEPFVRPKSLRAKLEERFKDHRFFKLWNLSPCRSCR